MKYAFIILFAVLQFLPIGFAQDYTKWELPEGAFARLGKGSVTGDIVFSPDSTIIAIPSSIGIWLYNAQTYKELALLTGHTTPVKMLAFSPDGATLASFGDRHDNTIRLWDMSNTSDIGKHKATLTTHRREILSIAFSSDGKMLASTSVDRTVILLSEYQGRLTISQDWNLQVSKKHGNIHLWNLKTGKLRVTIKEERVDFDAFAFLQGGATLISMDWSDTLHVWDAETGEFQMKIKTQGDIR